MSKQKPLGLLPSLYQFISLSQWSNIYSMTQSWASFFHFHSNFKLFYCSLFLSLPLSLSLSVSFSVYDITVLKWQKQFKFNISKVEVLIFIKLYLFNFTYLRNDTYISQLMNPKHRLSWNDLPVFAIIPKLEWRNIVTKSLLLVRARTIHEDEIHF